MGEATRQVGRAVFWSMLARTSRFVLGIASSIIVVRSLGEHDYGILSLIRAALAFILVIAGFGLGQSILKFIPVFKIARDRRGARGLVRRVALIQGTVWAALLAVCYFGAGVFESMFGFEGVGLFLWIAVALAFFEMAFLLITHVLQAYYDTKLLSLANVASHLVFIALLLVLLPRDWGVIGVFTAAAVGNVVATSIVIRRMLSYFDADVEPAADSGIDRRRILRFALPFAAIGVLNIIVWRQSEVLFLAHFQGAEVTGFFDLAYRLPQTLLEFVPGTVWPIIMAGISEVYTKNARDLNRAIDRYYRILFLLSAPICLTGIVIGGRLVTILYAESMAPAAVPAQLFFAIFTVSFFGTPLSMALYVIEKSHVNLLIYCGLAIINVGLDLLLIPRFGIVGAIIPVGIVILISPFVYKWALARYVSDTRVPFGFIARCFFASSPVLLLIPFTGYINDVFTLMAAILLAGCGMVFGFKVFKLIGQEELTTIGAVPIPALDRLLRYLASPPR